MTKMYNHPLTGEEIYSIDMCAILSGSQNHRCCYCGIRMILPYPKDRGECNINLDYYMKYRATIEHVTAKSKGGNDFWDNLVSACYTCNTSRGNSNAFKFEKQFV